MGVFSSRRVLRRAGRVLAVMSAGLVAAAVVAPAGAQAAGAVSLVNGGFEDGNLAGWSGGGASVVTSFYGQTAPSGSYFAVVAGGCSTNTLSQGFAAQAGQTLHGWSFFQAGDYLPYNDSGDVALSVSGGGRVATVFASSISQVGSYGGTGWREWSYTFPSTGQYTITASSSNAWDCGVNSYIGLDLESVAPDTTPPAITASATSGGNAYTSGTWTNQDVVVHFECTDDSGQVASLTGDRTVAEEGADQSVTGVCTDAAGNTAEATFGGIDIDLTGPAITWSGNAGTYAVDQQVQITCTASDALSGVASSTCADADAPAYTFALGSHDLSATATDHAGNTTSSRTTFAVEVGYPDLCALTRSFSTKGDVAQGLCAKLDAAAAADARGQSKTKANNLNAYAHQVAAQTGKALTGEQAGVLSTLAAAL